LNKYTLTIRDIIVETNDTITLSFKQPLFRKIKYRAGQYLTLILTVNGRKYFRPYSLSSSPSVDLYLDITVKRVPGGVVSNYIHEKLEVGNSIEVLEPIGEFTFDSCSMQSPIFLWGVGSGITPLYSIIKEILNLNSKTSVNLIYGNKTRETAIFRDKLDLLKQEYSDVFYMTSFYSQVNDIEERGNIHKGRISSEFVLLMAEQNKYLKEGMHYICGPKGLKDDINNSLKNLGVQSSSIFIEDFELVINPKDLFEVEDSKVTVISNGKSNDFFVPKGKSILDIALDNNIEIPYSCQTGNCNTCKVKLIDGKLKMLGLTKEREDLGLDEVLLCCSYPLTSSISIELI